MRRIALLSCVLAVMSLSAFAGDPLQSERGNMKAALKVVASDIQKNFYDPTIKGLDWKGLTEEAKQRIERATSYNEMVVAIYELVDRVDDAHSTFVPPWNSVRIEYGFEAQPYGDELRVYEIEKSGAAETAGLKIGDIIVQMNDYEKINRANWRTALIYSRALMPTSQLGVVVKRGKEYKTLVIEPKVQRGATVMNRYGNYAMFWGLVVENQNWEKKHYTYRTAVLDGNATTYKPSTDQKERFGYVDVRGFPFEGGDFLGGLVEEVKDTKALIIDLRRCPGGSVEALLQFAGLFASSETVLGTDASRNRKLDLVIKPRKPHVTVPIVVLVDSTTASAAEIITRYLQKQHGATVVGDKTYGALNTARYFAEEIGGQYMMDFAVVVTTDKFLFADGEDLEGKGVTPDVRCIPTQEDMQNGRDACLQAAVAIANRTAGRTQAVVGP